MQLEKTDKIITNIQKVVTIAAIVVGGLWTYNMFILHREGFPKADISYQIEEIKLSDEFIFIQVFIRVKNIGNTVLRLREAIVKLKDISFPNERFKEKIAEFRKNTYRKNPTFGWETIQYVIKKWGEGEIEIEPSTSDQLDFEFIIRSNHKFLKIYTWVTNLEKPIYVRYEKDDSGGYEKDEREGYEKDDREGYETYIGWRYSELYKIKSNRRISK